MADKDINSEQIDDDILRCKADALRARDIMPPYKKETEKERKSQKADENTSRSAQAPKPSAEKAAGKDAGSIPIETTVQKKTSPSTAKREEVEIPRFDLAEEIMAEQRKITAIRRKAPGKKTEAEWRQEQAEPDSYTIEQLRLEESEQSQIIKEIVARDIKKLCQGKLSDNRR